MKEFAHIVISVSMLAVAGCILVAKETRYLFSAKDRATEEEVRRHLGPPDQAVRHNGEDVWTYFIREFVQGGNNSWGTSGSWWCDEYVVRFDPRGIVRDWTHSSRKC